METRRQRAARAEAAEASVAEAAAPSLAEQPADVLALVGAELADALTPSHLTALASTCGALQLALRAAVAELKETRREVSALLRRCSNPRKTEYTLAQAAAGHVDVIFGGSKGLDASDARLMARCLFGNACFLTLTLTLSLSATLTLSLSATLTLTLTLTLTRQRVLLCEQPLGLRQPTAR